MNEKTIQHIIELLDKQEERTAKMEELIAGQQQQLTLLPDYRASVSAWNKELLELNNVLKQIKVPAQEIAALKLALSENTAIRKHPQEVKHHHYVPRIAMFAGALLLLLSLACAGWYNTAANGKQYRAADVRYRYLRLEKGNLLQQALATADSLYRADPSLMLREVKRREEEIQRRMELYRQAQEKEKEALELRQKAANRK